MPADLIVYAIVAAGLIFWLRNILGTRHGDEQERPNPYAPPPEGLTGRAEQPYMAEGAAPSPEERIMDLAQNPKGVLAVDNKTAENGLIEISRKIKGFDINDFLESAQDAFVIIVESFAGGDRETLKELLAPPVFETFEGAIAEREKRRETQETEIHAIRRAEVLEARLQDKMAYVTVRFVADETGVTRDEAGEILAGHPDRVTEMRDIWTFGRDIRSKDPVWLVFETRSDESDGDNDLIPNTDQD